ncbi:MAG: CARDB domain-containing protein [Alphaproteobacteria bacterium]
MGRNGTTARLRSIALLALAGAAAALAGNHAAAQVYHIALPDITSKRFSAKPETVQAGGTLEIRNAVQNLGAGPLTPAHGKADEAPTLTIRFLLVRNLKDADGLAAGSWSLDALGRREVKWHTARWTVPETTAPGPYFLCADIDPANAVRESNELNNRTCLPLTIKAALEIADGNTEDGEPPAEDGESGRAEEDEPGFSGLSGSPDRPETP